MVELEITREPDLAELELPALALLHQPHCVAKHEILGGEIIQCQRGAAHAGQHRAALTKLVSWSWGS